MGYALTLLHSGATSFFHAVAFWPKAMDGGIWSSSWRMDALFTGWRTGLVRSYWRFEIFVSCRSTTR